MSALLIIFSLLAYALAALLLWRERAWRAPLVLVAGSLVVLVLPFWMQLYRVVPGNRSVLDAIEISPSVAAVFGGPLIALPVLFFCAGLRQRWWTKNYAFIWLAYAVFVGYFLLLGRAVVEQEFVPALQLLGTRETLVLALLALLMAGVCLSIVFTLISSRDYGAVVAVLAIVASGVLATVIFWGLLGSPLWATPLLGIETLSDTVALVLAGVCGVLILWGVHLLASVLHAGRRREFRWN
jgi:hypothetical protein